MDFEGNQIIEHKASQKAGPMRRRGHYYSNTISLQNHRSLMILTTKFSNKKPFRIISPTFMAATAMMLEKWQIHAILWANYDLVNLAATESKRNGVVWEESVETLRNFQSQSRNLLRERHTGRLVGYYLIPRSNLWDIYACFMLVTSKHICSITGGIHILKCVVFQIFFWRFQWFADYLLLLYLWH